MTLLENPDIATAALFLAVGLILALVYGLIAAANRASDKKRRQW